MSAFSRGNRTASEPPLPNRFNAMERQVSRGSINRSSRDSIAGALQTFSESGSLNNIGGGSSKAAGGRKKKANLFWESFDPKAMKLSDVKVIPKSDESREIIANALLAHFLFSRLPDNEIIMLVNSMEKFELNSGDDIITQGDVGDYFYVVEDGSFEIVVNEMHVGDVGNSGKFIWWCLR